MEIKKGNIEGVLYKEPKINCDDRGFLMEICKQGEFYITILQTTFAVTHPGIIKAFHLHKHQSDLWFGVSGRAKAVLCDLRKDSPTSGKFEQFFLGEPNYGALLIPPGIAHGYQVLGNKDFALFYHTDKLYNPENPDEERIGFDKLNFDWEIINR